MTILLVFEELEQPAVVVQFRPGGTGEIGLPHPTVVFRERAAQLGDRIVQRRHRSTYIVFWLYLLATAPC